MAASEAFIGFLRIPWSKRSFAPRASLTLSVESDHVLIDSPASRANMSQRFFVESPIGDAPSARLIDAEAQHLAKVMRAKPGDEVTLFDGSGWEFTGRVSALGRSAVDLEI